MTTESRPAYLPVSLEDRTRLDILAVMSYLSRKEVMHRLLNSPCADEWLREVAHSRIAPLPGGLAEYLNKLADAYGRPVDMLVYEMADVYAKKRDEDAKLTAAYAELGRAQAAANSE